KPSVHVNRFIVKSRIGSRNIENVELKIIQCVQRIAIYLEFCVRSTLAYSTHQCAIHRFGKNGDVAALRPWAIFMSVSYQEIVWSRIYGGIVKFDIAGENRGK